MTTVNARHETNMAFMADGYARASGRPGIVVTTPGPGLGNIVTGCMEAYSDDVPLFVVHIDTDRKDHRKGILHELKEPENIFAHFIKAAFVVDEPTALRESLENALRACTAGRPGPVLLSIPFSFLDREIEGAAVPSTSSSGAPAVNGLPSLKTFLDDFSTILMRKKRPVIIGGKALMNPAAGGAIERICSRSNIPFLTSTGGKGIVDDDQPFCFGNIMVHGVAREILGAADLVIAAGTRLRDVDAKRRGVKIGELVHIDVDDRWIDRNYPAALRFTGDITAVLEGIAGILAGTGGFSWDMAALEGKQRSEQEGLTSSSGFRVIDRLRSVMPRETMVVCDLNIPSYWAEYYLPVHFQRTFLMPRGISPIFYSLAAAIGAKLARPDVPCIAICGDGGGLPQLSELATVTRYGIPLVVFVHNNSSYSILEDAMRERYGLAGTMELNNPDFVRLAESFGVRAKSTDSLDGLEDIFRRDVRWDEPFLIEYRDSVSSPPWRT